MTLGERVRKLLKDRNWSQAQLAQASGLDASILSRLLKGERPWRKEHIACVAAAMSTTPEDLVRDTDTTLDDGSEVDVEFIATLTRAHGELVSESARLRAELAGANLKLKQIGDEQQKLTQQLSSVQLSLDREKRARVTAESETRAAETRESALTLEVGGLKAERSTLMAERDSARLLATTAQAAQAQATEAANRNYAVAKDLEKRLSSAKGVATVTSLLGLAMVVGKALDTPPPRGGRGRGG